MAHRASQTPPPAARQETAPPTLVAPLARPTQIPGQAFAYAAQPSPPRALAVGFPMVPTTRARAALDVALMLAFVLVSMLWASVFAVGLAERWPTLGLFSSNLVVGVLALAGVGLVLILRRQSVATIGLNRTSWQRVLLAAAICVPACFTAGAIANLTYVALSGFDVDGFLKQRTEFFAEIPRIPLHWMLPFALFVGVHEEVLFRGFLLSRLRTACGSTALSVILTSVIFGALHFYQGPAGVFQTTAVGVVLSIMVCYTRTLWPAILAHAVFDTIGLIAAGLLSDMAKELQVPPAAISGC